ncbi:MAG: Arc family DNA-binding protein [Actinomycetota bacterium]|nr:Arc family DNA-binding protein [Actinomycetota bacterium]
MGDVPAIHVRNVPADVVERLKQRAKRNGRSLNAELVDLLGASVENDREPGWVARRLEELHAKYPPIDEPIDAAELIREGREERDRAIEAALRRPRR